jgi:hypothetical protein
MANWTKAQLLADLAAMYVTVGTPYNPNEEGVVDGVIKYMVNVNECGASETNEKPTGYRKNIVFYVYHEGLGDEKAWYERSEPVNTSNTTVASSTPSLFYAYSRVYSSVELRQRVLGWIIKAAITELGTPTSVLKTNWAKDVLKCSPTKYLDAFMCYISESEDVRTSGNAVADTDLAWLGYMVNAVATAFGISAT